ncbi:MAG: WbqC family protein [Chitinophagaceae bacterium]
MVLSTQYFPSVSWMQAFLLQDDIQIAQWENYQKQGLMNRCKIMGAQGIITLSVPLTGGREQKTLVKDVGINNTTRWQTDQLRAITSCYRKAPFYEYYFQQVESLILVKHDNLLEFNVEILKLLIRWFKWGGQVRLTTNFAKDQPASSPSYDSQFLRPYIQVFSDRRPFEANLSVLDLLFCTGPQAKTFLLS